MYQPDDLEVFEIPTVRETRADPAEPGRTCPARPDRECLLRHLYSVKHGADVRCATCGPVASQVHKYRTKGQSLIKAKETVAVPPLVTSSSERRKKKGSGKERSSLTPEMIEARKVRALKALEIAREKRKKCLLAEGGEADDTRNRDRDARKKATREKNRVDRMARAMRQSTISLRLVRSGQKTPSRVQATVLFLEGLIKKGKFTIQIKDAMKEFNSIRGVHRVHTNGLLSMSFRDYGLTVRTAFSRDAGRNIATLYIDEAAKSFIDGGYFYHEHGNGRWKR